MPTTRKTLTKSGVEFIHDLNDSYLDISWNKERVDVEVFRCNGYDEHDASSFSLSKEEWEEIINHYKKYNNESI